MARIVLFGQAAFGKSVLEGLLAAGHEVTGVCVPPDRAGRAVDPLKQGALDAGLRVVQRRSYRDADAAAEVAAETADLGVLAFVTQIIPPAILDAPRLASLCFHPSLLPAYRGGSAIPWQLIKGETRGGVTLFRPDDGIDAGPIYLQREIEIGPDDSAGSFYYARVFDVAVAATLEAVGLVVHGKASGAVQDESVATYDPLLGDAHAGIDWSRPAADLHNLVRGCDPAPGAHALFGATRLRLYGSRRAGEVSAGVAPGTVLSLDGEGLCVAASDGALRFAKLKATGEKAGAAEVAAQLGLAIGDVLSAAPSV